MTHKGIDQFTIRGIPAEVARHARALADREGISLNRAILRLLEIATGIRPGDSPRARAPIGDAVKRYAGTMSPEEIDALDRVIEEIDRLDKRHGP